MMLHVRYFCKKPLKRKNPEKIEDCYKIGRLVNNEKSIEDQPQLSTVTNQLNNKIKTNSSSSLSSNYLINDQKNLFYEKYLQNLNAFLNNSVNMTLLQHQVKNSLNTVSLYPIPALMSSIINNNLLSNNSDGNSTSRRIKKFEPTTKNDLNKQKPPSSLKTGLNNLKSNSKRMKNIEFITPSSSFNLQNCCAKCNAQFCLTSDLVYHMRTCHKREKHSLSNNSFKIQTAEHELKKLKCEICNENFREKHHLTRHMTSHR
jgi:hypothetical protein